MPRTIQDPVTVQDGRTHVKDGTKTTHPAFAQISASRVSGYTALYGSDFRHNHYVIVRIDTSELNRDLNRDWHYASKRIIEVAMSESQWATFVSAMNVGSGTPCTLQYANGEQVPGLPDPQSRVDQFSNEVNAKLKRMIGKIQKQIDDIHDDVDSLGLSKSKAEKMKAKLSSSLQATLVDLNSNLPFVAQQFSEHMEDAVQKGKGEIHGYMTSTLQRMGIAAVNNGALPLLLTDESGDDLPAEDDDGVQEILDWAKEQKRSRELP